MRWVKLTLPPRVRPEVAVDDPAVDLEQPCREPHGSSSPSGRRGSPPCWRRCGRRRRAAARPSSSAAGFGVGAAAGASAAFSGAAAFVGAAGRRGRGHGLVLIPPVVGEELLPALAHRLRVGEVLLVHLVDEPLVRPERVRGISHRVAILPAVRLCFSAGTGERIGGGCCRDGRALPRLHAVRRCPRRRPPRPDDARGEGRAARRRLDHRARRGRRFRRGPRAAPARVTASATSPASARRPGCARRRAPRS